MGADMVFHADWGNSGPHKNIINHADQASMKVQAQSILFGDGHVANETSFYTRPLFVESVYQTFRYSTGGGFARKLHIYYWGTGR